MNVGVFMIDSGAELPFPIDSVSSVPLTPLLHVSDPPLDRFMLRSVPLALLLHVYDLLLECYRLPIIPFSLLQHF